MATMRIPVKGMACEACSHRLEARLNDSEGIAEAKVDLKAERATVHYDPQLLDPHAIGELIRDTGFEPQIDDGQS